MDKEELIQIAKKYKTDVSHVVFVIETCDRLGIEPTGTVFYRSPKEIEIINALCRNHGINPNNMKTVFKKSAEEAELIFAVCDKTKMQINSKLFDKQTEEVMKSVVYVAQNYGRKYLKPHIVTRNVEKLKLSMPYLKEKGLLEYVVEDSAVLELNPDEILERTVLIDYLGYPRHKRCRYSQVEKLNVIYELGSEKYKTYLEGLSGSDQIIRIVRAKVQQIKESEDEPKN